MEFSFVIGLNPMWVWLFLLLAIRNKLQTGGGGGGGGGAEKNNNYYYFFGRNYLSTYTVYIKLKI